MKSRARCHLHLTVEETLLLNMGEIMRGEIHRAIKSSIIRLQSRPNITCSVKTGPEINDAPDTKYSQASRI